MGGYIRECSRPGCRLTYLAGTSRVASLEVGAAESVTLEAWVRPTLANGFIVNKKSGACAPCGELQRRR